MKFLILQLATILFSLVSYAGIDMPMATLLCGPDKALQIQFRELESDGKKFAGSVAWIQSQGQRLQTVNTSLAHDKDGNRTISYGDFFCTRSLNEKSENLWELQSSCEGQEFTSVCSRVE